MNPQEIKERLEKEVDLSHVQEVLRAETIQNLTYKVMKKLVTEIMQKIPPNRLEEFNMVSEGGDSEKTKAFLSNYIHNIDAFTEDIIQKEVEIYKKINN